MQCSACDRIPRDLFTENFLFTHLTWPAIKESSKAGCGICKLIDDSLSLSQRRGTIRGSPREMLYSNVILYHRYSWSNWMELFIHDDISPMYGEPLWFDVLDDKTSKWSMVSQWV